MQEQTVRGALQDLRGQILNTWEALADQELKKAKQNVAELGELLQKKVDSTKEMVGEKVSFLLSRFNAGFEKNHESESGVEAAETGSAKKRIIKTVDTKKTKH